MEDQNRRDQFFLVDEKVIQDLVVAAEIKKSDWVLEVGAGRGVITRILAKAAGRVLAVEIDQQFRRDLNFLPKNTEVFWEDILKILSVRPKFNKIVGNLPSSLVEPLFQRLKSIKFDLAVFLVPLKFMDNLENNPFYTAYFQAELIRKVEKTAFEPQPKTNWALVKIIKKPDPLKVKDYDRFLWQYLDQHPQAKLKNALVEAVILIEKSKKNFITKNQAREIVGEMKIPEELWEKPIHQNTTNFRSWYFISEIQKITRRQF